MCNQIIDRFSVDIIEGIPEQARDNSSNKKLREHDLSCRSEIFHRLVINHLKSHGGIERDFNERCQPPVGFFDRGR